jgi:hypothetical protein
MTGAPDICGAASGFSDGNGLRNQSADGVLQDVRCDAGTSAMAYVIHVWHWLALRPRHVTWQTGSRLSIGGFFRAKLPAPSAAVSPALAPIPAMCAAKFSIASQLWIEKAYFSFAMRRVRPRFPLSEARYRLVGRLIRHYSNVRRKRGIRESRITSPAHLTRCRCHGGPVALRGTGDRCPLLRCISD